MMVDRSDSQSMANSLGIMGAQEWRARGGKKRGKKRMEQGHHPG
jgi:hypothetical protein